MPLLAGEAVIGDVLLQRSGVAASLGRILLSEEQGRTGDQAAGEPLLFAWCA